MLEQQLDLFSAAGIPAEQPVPQGQILRPAVADLDNDALIAAIPAANLGETAPARRRGPRRDRTDDSLEVRLRSGVAVNRHMLRQVKLQPA